KPTALPVLCKPRPITAPTPSALSVRDSYVFQWHTQETMNTNVALPSLDIEPAKACAERIKSIEIKPAATNFAKNLVDVAGLLGLPTRLLSLGNLHAFFDLVRWITKLFG